ncbi:MAG: hypothetical protein ABJZ55_11755 [Fuerstiella sp.]
MLNRLVLTFAVLLIASPAWAQSGSRNIVPPPTSGGGGVIPFVAPPAGGSGTRNEVPSFAPSSGGSGTRNAVPSQSLSTPQPPFSQLPSELPPVGGPVYSSPSQVQYGSCGPGGCSVSQPQYIPYAASSQPIFNSTPYYSSGFGSGCSSQPSFSSGSSYYRGSYYQAPTRSRYQPQYQPSYRSSYRRSCR